MLSFSTLLIAASLTAPSDLEIVKFTAEWCAPCRAMEPMLKQVAQQGYRISRIDIDQRPELAKRYRVTSVPTIFLVANGRVVDRIDGAVDMQQLTARLDQVGQPSTAQSSPGRPANARSAPRRAAAQSHRPPAAGQPSSEAERFARQATVRLQVEDASGHSFGTGTVVHMHGPDALILTCGHIFRDSQGKGRIAVDLFASESRERLKGELIRFDLDRDLALVGIHTNVPLKPARVAGPAYHVAMGQRLFSMGCDQGRPPTPLRGQLRAVNKYLGPENLVVSGRPTDGRSGGGLFSHDGQLVGVCNAADPEVDEGLYAAFASVHRHLDEAKLAFVYRNATNTAIAASTRGPRNAAPAGIPPTLGAPLPVRPVSAIAPRGTEIRASQNLARGAAGDEPDGAEVICIIRPKNRSHDKSEVVVLDRPSRDFITHLNRELDRQHHRQATQMRVPEANDARAPSPVRSARGRDAGWKPNALRDTPPR